jgi:predicted transcriptional regulator of viral defense system
MNYPKLASIDKLYFGYHELARALAISIPAARVTASRYVQRGLLVRLKRNVYVLAERWTHLTTQELFILANVLQTPSYVSLTSALSFYEISTQVQREFIESIAVNRTTSYAISGVTFKYFKVKRTLCKGFTRRQEYFIADPEKAFIDALYLTWRGHYALDLPAINRERLDAAKLAAILADYPDRFTRYVARNA